jgi:MoaA/NifB/PqqE/SkfB family radical SAM enzyme
MEYLHDVLYKRIQDKIVERLYEWANGRTAWPARMVFHPTLRCNLACLYCTGILIKKGLFNKEMLKKENELSKREWVRIAKEGAKLGIIEWDVCGGEPLLRADTLLAMIQTIKKINPEAVIILATNGLFLNSKIAKELVRLECDILQLSIDGANPKTHDFLRGKSGSFKKITNAGKLVASIKKKLNKEKPIIQVNTVLNSMTYYELPDLVKLTYSLGGSHFIANPMRVSDANLPFVKEANIQLTMEQIAQFPKVWKEVEKIGKELGIHLSTGYFGGEILHENKGVKIKETSLKNVKQFLDIFCIGPFYSLMIDSIGNVGRCASAITIDSPLNIKGKSLKEVWYGKFFKSARELMYEGKPLGKECDTCGIVNERFFICSRLCEMIETKKPRIVTFPRGHRLEIETREG